MWRHDASSNYCRPWIVSKGMSNIHCSLLQVMMKQKSPCLVTFAWSRCCTIPRFSSFQNRNALEVWYCFVDLIIHHRQQLQQQKICLATCKSKIIIPCAVVLMINSCRAACRFRSSFTSAYNWRQKVNISLTLSKSSQLYSRNNLAIRHLKRCRSVTWMNAVQKRKTLDVDNFQCMSAREL